MSLFVTMLRAKGQTYTIYVRLRIARSRGIQQIVIYLSRRQKHGTKIDCRQKQQPDSR